MLAALDQETLREFYATKKPRTKANRFVEEFLGPKLSRDESDAELPTPERGCGNTRCTGREICDFARHRMS
jgi:hypothetical protein